MIVGKERFIENVSRKTLNSIWVTREEGKGDLFLEEKSLSFVLDWLDLFWILVHTQWLFGYTPGSDLRDHF